MQQVLNEVQAVGVKGHDSGPLGAFHSSVSPQWGPLLTMGLQHEAMEQTLACLAHLGGKQPLLLDSRRPQSQGHHVTKARQGQDWSLLAF